LAAVPSTGPASRAGVDAHALYERQYPLVLRFCRSKLRSREDAEDAAQTTFFHALGSLRQGTVPTVETAWLLTIARNVCLNRWDATRRRSRVEVARDPHVLQAVAPGREDSDVDLIGLQDALGRLTEPQRRAILLREWQGLSYAEIATELELTESAVETLLFRARRSLARELQGGRSLRDLGSLLGGLKSLLGGAGALKLAAGVAAVVAVAIAAVPQLQRTQARRPAGGAPAVTRPAKTEARAASSSLTREGTTPPAQRGGRSSSHSPVTASAPAAPAASGPATAPPSSAPAPAAASSSEPSPPDATPKPPANESTTPPIAPPVPQLPTVDAPSLPSLPAVPPLPVTPPVSVPSLPALPTVDPPVVTVPLPKLP
jgi:RNA polymerase sigma factor (sigma-70 family)